MDTFKRRNGCSFRSITFLVGIVVFICMAGVSVFFFFFGSRFFQSVTSSVSSLGGPSVNISGVPGDPSHFDPIAQYDAIHKFAGESLELDSIIVTYVRSDGTLDLSAPYDPRVDYKFFRELSTPPPSAPPLGVRGVTDQKWDDQVEVLVQPSRLISIGGNVQGLTAIPAPKCSMKTLWSAALEKGASADAVANVVINKSGYYFSIR